MAQMYFRGRDYRLYRYDVDTKFCVLLGEGLTSATPIAYGDYIYLLGTDEGGLRTIWRQDLDGGNGVVMSSEKSQTPPAVTPSGLYFQGANNKMFRCTFDGTTTAIPNDFIADGQVPCIYRNMAYFQGVDGLLYAHSLDGSTAPKFPGVKITNSPLAVNDYLYFKGTGDNIWRTKADGTGDSKILGTSTDPGLCVTDKYLFYRGRDNNCYRTNLDGTNTTKIAGETLRAPAADDTYAYIVGGSWNIWVVNYQTGEAFNTHCTTESTCFAAWSFNQPQTSTLYPTFQVVSVLYAPPGSSASPGVGRVTYWTESTTGTFTSTAQTYSSQYLISASANLADVATFGVSNTASSSVTVEQGVDISKSAADEVHASQGAIDGIHHDDDRFLLWVNPMQMMAKQPSSLGLNWTLTASNGTAMKQIVTVAEIKAYLADPPVESNEIRELVDNYKFTRADFKSILSTNPFVDGSTTISLDRFELLPTTILYTSDDAVGETLTLTNTSSSTTTTTAEVSYETSFEEGAGFDSNDLSASQTYTWASTSSVQTSSETSQEASAEICGPGPDYKGSTTVFVYLDKIYQTFMFTFAVPPRSRAV